MVRDQIRRLEIKDTEGYNEEEFKMNSRTHKTI